MLFDENCCCTTISYGILFRVAARVFFRASNNELVTALNKAIKGIFRPSYAFTSLLSPFLIESPTFTKLNSA